MYPQSIQHALDKAHARVGDRIRVERNGHAYEGLLMPKTDMGDPETIILKLDSGYNVGIRLPDGAAIQ
ncbi:MAG: Glu-tRNA(Gln) amidotransferase GatDE subunit D, partial [Candidatus Aenigmarchaeota archaeon]|nr:Glu-tRNA(Gln) amidotransferase GatDE subunit D [Candidatus Aenigmarchaeota archaeon]